MSERQDTGESRDLATGARITGCPCVVTIERVTQTLAYGHCDTCDHEHVIDRRRYEAGRGPWHPADFGSSVEDDA